MEKILIFCQMDDIVRHISRNDSCNIQYYIRYIENMHDGIIENFFFGLTMPSIYKSIQRQKIKSLTVEEILHLSVAIMPRIDYRLNASERRSDLKKILFFKVLRGFHICNVFGTPVTTPQKYVRVAICSK